MLSQRFVLFTMLGLSSLAPGANVQAAPSSPGSGPHPHLAKPTPTPSPSARPTPTPTPAKKWKKGKKTRHTYRRKKTDPGALAIGAKASF